MARQIPFTEHEAVLLLEAYLQTISSDSPRLHFVRKVSEDLRKMAMNNGREIDEVYRNVNGISFQMASMESAYQGHTIRKPATKLFLEISELYKNDRKKFLKLLEEAKAMVEEKKTIAEQFSLWLSAKVSPAQLSELFLCYHDIEEFCLKIRILKAPLFETTDLATVKKAQKAVTENRIFQLQHKKQMKKIVSAAQLYTAFIKELGEKTAEGNKPADVLTQDEVLPVTEHIDMQSGLTNYDDLVRNEADRTLQEKYPLLFKKVYTVLAQHNEPMSVEKLQSEIGMFFRVTDIFTILMQASWSTECTGGNYKYTKEPVVHEVPAMSTKAGMKSAETSLTSDENEFYHYLSKVAKMAEATCRSYVSALRNIERYAKEHGYSQTKIYGQGPESVRAISDELFRDKDFIEYNAQQHNRFRAAINKLLESMDSGKLAKAVAEDQPVKPNYGDVSDFEKVLEERFIKGFRLGSSLEMKKFKRYYEELNGKAISKDDSEIEKIIRSCGIIHEEKVFMPKTMLSDVIKDKLLRFIADSFNNGKASVYYEAMFKEFSEDFLDHYIYNAEMLKAYLIYVNDGTYHIGRNQITKEAGASSDPIDEVRGCLKDHGRPMGTDKLCEILSHLPRNNVVAILGSNLEFVRNSKGEYFHADVMSLSEEELENIAEIIEDAIQSHNFISGTELVKAIKAKYPYTYEAYSAYSDIAWRDALKYKIGSRFSFKGNIISAIGSTLSMTDVFGDLAANAEQLSMDELLSFADEMGTVIYFDAVYDNALRVNDDLFVSKKQARFQVKETDTILDRFVTGSYLPLKDVTVFGIFPEAGFAWNIYLLESYVASYSERYALIHGGFNRNCAVGAIVKRSAGYQDLDDLIVDVLADSNINLNKPDALDYLVKNGYIARRTYSGIEGLLIRANAKRQTGRRT